MHNHCWLIKCWSQTAEGNPDQWDGLAAAEQQQSSRRERRVNQGFPLTILSFLPTAITHKDPPLPSSSFYTSSISITLCFLTIYTMWPAASNVWSHDFLSHHNGLYSQTLSQNQPLINLFFLKLLCLDDSDHQWGVWSQQQSRQVKTMQRAWDRPFPFFIHCCFSESKPRPGTAEVLLKHV